MLFVDESRAPLENSGAPARAPAVRQTVDAGMHTFRVHPGYGLDDSIVVRMFVSFERGAEVALVLVGASSNFREMCAISLFFNGRRYTADRFGGKETLVARRAFGSVGAVTFACLLMLIAAAIRGAAAPFEAWLAGETESSFTPTAPFVSGVAACTAIYLLARVSFLFELSPAASSIAAAVGAISALGAACAALASSTALRFVGHVAAVAQFGFARPRIRSWLSPDRCRRPRFDLLARHRGARARVVARRFTQEPIVLTSCRLRIGRRAHSWSRRIAVSDSCARCRARLGSPRFRISRRIARRVRCRGCSATLGFASWRWLQITFIKRRQKGRENQKKIQPNLSKTRRS